MSEEPPYTERSRKRKKTLNACQRCRQHKIKCSGERPCQSCLPKQLSCVYETKERKVAVSEQYLQELRDRAAARPHSSPTTPLQQSSLTHNSHSHLDALSQSILTGGLTTPIPRDESDHQDLLDIPPESITADNPGPLGDKLPVSATAAFEPGAYGLSETTETGLELTGSDSQLAVGDKYRQLGHSSSWSFSRRVRELIKETETGPNMHDQIPIRDGAYGVPWRCPRVDLSDLELFSIEYAEYLLTTISFCWGSMYYLFDKGEFLRRLRLFHEKRDTEEQPVSDLWLIQMLTVFALGKSMNSREAGASGPSGHLYFARAAEALPDIHHLYEEPILAIEILCSFALFLQALDMRLAAYGYAGNAIGMCLTLGLNRRHDATRITDSEFSHRSKLFWTIYVIDRKLSSLIGVPPRLHDEDIALPRPGFIPGGDVTQDITVFHVELSSQLGQVLNVVYGLGLQRQLGPNFVHAIRAILKRQLEISRLLQDKLRLNFDKSASYTCRATASLHVLHHLCTILVIRPIAFFVFEKTIGSAHVGRLSDATRRLLRMCSDAALTIQTIMEELTRHKLIDLLFPFDVDAIFASAFVLILIDIIAPSGQPWDMSETLRMMDDMAMRGFKVVGPYRQDLIEVDAFRQRARSPREPAYGPLTDPDNFDRAVDHPAFDPAFQAAPDPVGARDRSWAASNGRSRMLHQDDYQSVGDLFIYRPPDNLSESEVDPCAWMWDDSHVPSF